MDDAKAVDTEAVDSNDADTNDADSNDADTDTDSDALGAPSLQAAVEALLMLADEPMHGYEIIRRLEEESKGMYSPSPGSIYPPLQMLEDQEFVLSEQQDGKRVYNITKAGRAFRKEHTAQTDDIFSRFVNLGERFAGHDMREVTKSFIRLAQLSFDRAAASNGDSTSMERLKEILDRTANEIESAWPKADSIEIEV